MDAHPDWRAVLQLRIRAIENRHAALHKDLLDWGRWGRGWDADKPRLSPSALWLMPGDPDPNRDEDAPPAPVAVPINERRVLQLDARIGDIENFPAVWRKVLKVNYVGGRTRRGTYEPLLEYQRPREAFPGSPGSCDYSYCMHLEESLLHLASFVQPRPA